MFDTNKIDEAVELFWRQTGVKENGAATCCFTLSWEQKLYNKKRAEEILNSCTKDELIDYIIYKDRRNNMVTTVSSLPPYSTKTINE